jgi:sugar (pentulose or hexulose) kinase
MKLLSFLTMGMTTTTKTITGYLGIDNGTQGLSVIFTDESLKVLATGEGSYDFVPGLEEGCYEQTTEDWERALAEAMEQVHQSVPTMDVRAIGISGQMHGEVLADEAGQSLGPVRLWCDSRNEAEGHELTQATGTKFAKRATATRFLWTTRNRPERAAKTRHITTPAGWLAYKLTGEWNLGIGDAAGMFPMDATELNYDRAKLEIFDKLVPADVNVPSIASLLPNVKKAGEDAGCLNEAGAALLKLPVGIPVAAAEGDQVAALAGSLIGRPGMVSCSFGTSVCANIVGDRAFVGVSPAVDHFCAADGRPIHMVWLRNGTTFLNSVIQSYGSVIGEGNDTSVAFAKVMPELIRAAADCGGLIALPFMDDEPGLEVSVGGSALILGWNAENAKAGNVAKAALLSTMFNLRLGCEVLDQQGFPRTELVLTGGLTKTPECGQILADVFHTPVTLLESAEEGCSWGAAVMAKFRYLKSTDENDTMDWATFLESVATEARQQRFEPNEEAVPAYEKQLARYRKLIQLQPQLNQVMSI